MATVKVEKNTYTVEPLYQWDLNQQLEIYGLSLASVPEIHFANAAMDRAIVRQASMDAAGVVRADIPNSLLQKPYTVQAYVCVYEGATFETQYKLEIPVKARSKPSDYTLEDDPEVYSFNALENQVVNALAACAEAEGTYAAAKATYEKGMAELDEKVATATKKAVSALTADDVGSYKKEEVLASATKTYAGLASTAVPDAAFQNIFTKLKLVTGGIAEATITLVDTDGSPVVGVEVTNVLGADGTPALSDEAGVISGFIVEGTVELAVKDYFEFEDCGETIEVIRGNAITKTFTVTRRDEIEITESCSKRFSPEVSNFDVCAVGGGGGGGGGSSAQGSGADSGDCIGGGGGGGGYATNVYAIQAVPNADYSIVIGAGGAGGGGGYSNTDAADTYTGKGGTSGGSTIMTLSEETIAEAFGGGGGNGGTGGGKGDDAVAATYPTAGGDGNGSGGHGGWAHLASNSPGEGISGSVYVFDDTALILPGGGGGGGGRNTSSSTYRTAGKPGGASYGGAGNGGNDPQSSNSSTSAAGHDASGYGGGGGGGAGNWVTSGSSYYAGNGGKGYQGVIFLRWRYKTA